MTAAHLDRRVNTLEARVAHSEECIIASQLRLTRRVSSLEIYTRRLGAQQTTIGQGIALMMERMGLPPIHVADVEIPTEAEIDAALEEDC